MGSSTSKGSSGQTRRSSAGNTNNNNVTSKRRKIRSEDDLVPSTLPNTLLENVFLLTYGCVSGDMLPGECVLLEKPCDQASIQLSLDCISQCLSDRVYAKSADMTVVIPKCPPEKPLIPAELVSADEPSSLRYLYMCFQRLKILETSKVFTDMTEDVSACRSAIMTASRDYLQKFEKRPGVAHRSFLALCLENKEKLNDTKSRIHEFLTEVVVAKEKGDGGVESLERTMFSVLDLLRDWFRNRKLSDTELDAHLTVLKFFSDLPSLSMVLLKHTEPKEPKGAPSYEKTTLGIVMSLSSCPSKVNGPFEFFENPLDMSRTEIHASLLFIWQRLEMICGSMHNILYNCMKHSPQHRHRVLSWIGHVLEANRPKPDIWCAHEAEVFDDKYCSDGFCLNLCGVLLKLCKPFSYPENTNLLDIEPIYCRQPTPNDEDAQRLCIHTRGLSKEEPFVPHDDVAPSPPSDRGYRYVTECYFLTQQALHIGCSIVFKLLKLNTDIGRLKKLYEEMKEVYPAKILNILKAELNRENRLFINMNAALQNVTRDAFNFHIASASLLVQLALTEKPTSFEQLRLPLPDFIPTSIKCLPEFIMSNVTRLTFQLQLTNELALLKEKKSNLHHFLSLILVFMGNSDRLHNPEIRAGLAESLEATLPTQNEDGTWPNSESGALEDLLITHPLIADLPQAILHVFVSIEKRGQSVDSEKMFNYRRSMHKVLQYIWRMPLHKAAMKTLADKALESIDNTEPPLFLRFINLLVNDSIFLLDEALDHMKQIRACELERDKGAWDRDKELGLRFLKMIGRHRNTTANLTIYTLMLLTKDLCDIFCHSVMVDRITGMLNYFLEHLVGPKQIDYKVSNRRELDFRPEQLVSDITHIYLYLGTSEHFCKAVLGESRSFSHGLFDSAVPILRKIGVPEDFISSFGEFGQKLKSLEKSVQREEELMADVPEEFLDPIMGTLMVEPVILPTSSTTVDRAVIARHLLSDQTDPFNRQPLSLNMVKTNVELKAKIEQWKADVGKQNQQQPEVT